MPTLSAAATRSVSPSAAATGSAVPTLTRTSTASGTRSISGTVSRSVTVSPSPTCSVLPPRPVPFTAGNLVALRIGDGLAALASASQLTVVYLDEFDTTGKLVQSVQLSGYIVDNLIRIPNSFTLPASGLDTLALQGQLSRSPDGLYLYLGGYRAPVFTSSASTTVDRTYLRVGNDPLASLDFSTSVRTTSALTVYAVAGDGIDNNMWVAETLGSSGYIDRYPIGNRGGTTVSSDDSVVQAQYVLINDGDIFVSKAASGVCKISGTPKTSLGSCTSYWTGPSGTDPRGMVNVLSSSGYEELYVASYNTGVLRIKNLALDSTWVPGGATPDRQVIGLAANDARTRLFITTRTALYAMSIPQVGSTAAPAFLNGGLPIARAASGTEFRGLAQAPVPMGGRLTAGNLVLTRTHSELTDTFGSLLFLEEYSPAGVMLRAAPVPYTTAGARLTVDASVAQSGKISVAADESGLILAGYDVGRGGDPYPIFSSVTHTIARVSCNLAFTFGPTMSSSSERYSGAATGTSSSARYYMSGSGGLHVLSSGTATSGSLVSSIDGFSQAIFSGGTLGTPQLLTQEVTNPTALDSWGGAPTGNTSPTRMTAVGSVGSGASSNGFSFYSTSFGVSERAVWTDSAAGFKTATRTSGTWGAVTTSVAATFLEHIAVAYDDSGTSTYGVSASRIFRISGSAVTQIGVRGGGNYRGLARVPKSCTAARRLSHAGAGAADVADRALSMAGARSVLLNLTHSAPRSLRELGISAEEGFEPVVVLPKHAHELPVAEHEQPGQRHALPATWPRSEKAIRRANSDVHAFRRELAAAAATSASGSSSADGGDASAGLPELPVTASVTTITLQLNATSASRAAAAATSQKVTASPLGATLWYSRQQPVIARCDDGSISGADPTVVPLAGRSRGPLLAPAPAQSSGAAAVPAAFVAASQLLQLPSHLTLWTTPLRGRLAAVSVVLAEAFRPCPPPLLPPRLAVSAEVWADVSAPQSAGWNASSVVAAAAAPGALQFSCLSCVLLARRTVELPPSALPLFGTASAPLADSWTTAADDAASELSRSAAHVLTLALPDLPAPSNEEADPPPLLVFVAPLRRQGDAEAAGECTRALQLHSAPDIGLSAPQSIRTWLRAPRPGTSLRLGSATEWSPRAGDSAVLALQLQTCGPDPTRKPVLLDPEVPPQEGRCTGGCNLPEVTLLLPPLLGAGEEAVRSRVGRVVQRLLVADSLPLTNATVTLPAPLAAGEKLQLTCGGVPELLVAVRLAGQGQGAAPAVNELQPTASAEARAGAGADSGFVVWVGAAWTAESTQEVLQGVGAAKDVQLRCRLVSAPASGGAPQAYPSLHAFLVPVRRLPSAWPLLTDVLVEVVPGVFRSSWSSDLVDSKAELEAAVTPASWQDPTVPSNAAALTLLSRIARRARAFQPFTLVAPPGGHLVLVAARDSADSFPAFTATSNVTLNGLPAPVNWVSPDGQLLSVSLPAAIASCGGGGCGTVRVELGAGLDTDLSRTLADAVYAAAPRRLGGARRAAAGSSLVLPGSMACPPACPRDWPSALGGTSMSPAARRALLPPLPIGAPPAAVPPLTPGVLPWVAIAEGALLLSPCDTTRYTDPATGACSNASDPASYRCAWGTGSDCVPCPEGALCPGGRRLWPRPGYSIASETSRTVEPCPEPDATLRCPGIGPLLEGSVQPGGGGGLPCGEGFASGTAGCMGCADGFFPHPDGTCAPCDADARSGSAAAVARPAAVFGAGLLAVLLLCLISGAALSCSVAGRPGCGRKSSRPLRASLRAATRDVLWLFAIAQVVAQAARSHQSGGPALLTRIYTVLVALQFEGPDSGVNPACIQNGDIFRSAKAQFAFVVVSYAFLTAVVILGNITQRILATRTARAAALALAGDTDTGISATSCKTRLTRGAQGLLRLSQGAEAALVAVLFCLYAIISTTAFVTVSCPTVTSTARAYLTRLGGDGSQLRKLGWTVEEVAQLVAVSEQRPAPGPLFASEITARLDQELRLSVMASMPTVVCYEGAHEGLASAAWLCILLFVVGFPIALALRGCCRPPQLQLSVVAAPAAAPPSPALSPLGGASPASAEGKRPAQLLRLSTSMRKLVEERLREPTPPPPTTDPRTGKTSAVVLLNPFSFLVAGERAGSTNASPRWPWFLHMLVCLVMGAMAAAAPRSRDALPRGLRLAAALVSCVAAAASVLYWRPFKRTAAWRNIVAALLYVTAATAAVINMIVVSNAPLPGNVMSDATSAFNQTLVAVLMIVLIVAGAVTAAGFALGQIRVAKYASAQRLSVAAEPLPAKMGAGKDEFLPLPGDDEIAVVSPLGIAPASKGGSGAMPAFSGDAAAKLRARVGDKECSGPVARAPRRGLDDSLSMANPLAFAAGTARRQGGGPLAVRREVAAISSPQAGVKEAAAEVEPAAAPSPRAGTRVGAAADGGRRAFGPVQQTSRRGKLGTALSPTASAGAGAAFGESVAGAVNPLAMPRPVPKRG